MEKPVTEKGDGGNLPSAEGASPALAQWFAAKEAHPDALVFFRMGDFYELFFTDAERAAAALDIALTHRGVHRGQKVPMCGVPVATAELYLGRLIRQGFKVAIVEQTEAPRRGSKTPIRREVVRRVTPGTLTEEGLLEPARPQLLAALAEAGRTLGLAWIDLAGGRFVTAKLTPETLPAHLAALDPAEILASPDTPLPPEWAGRSSPPPLVIEGAERARAELCRLYGVAGIKGFGLFSDAETIAAARAALYVEESHGGRFPPLPPPLPGGEQGRMLIDPASRQSLGLTLPPQDPAALQSALGRTRSAAGLRLLGEWIASPLTDRAAIEARAEAWAWFLGTPRLLEALGRSLAGAPDLARALGRITVGRALPRDLAALRDGALLAQRLSTLFPEEAPSPPLPDRLAEILATLRTPRPFAETLTRALADPLPPRFEEGEVIAAGFDEALDRERALRDEARRFVAALERELAERLAVPQLRIRHHAQLGYVIELPRAAAARLRDEPSLIFRQATAQGGRFTTPPLLDLERRLAEAAAAATRREQELIGALLAEALAARDDFARLAQALAELDVLLAAAELARREGWCRPVLREDLVFRIRGGRHPVVAAALGREGRFVPNDCDLSPPRRLMLLTGPNMAGKSTYLRQNALIAILAQAGLPVPAREAEIGIVDKIFSRVGADDDLVRGRSTFLVEMTETAAILNQATPRSLVVVDEIGRGTATLDGLAIAWAVLEALHDRVRARTLFATHFHELGRLAGELPHLVPYAMKVTEHRGRLVFLHEVTEGAANRSFGVHVARLAGVPAPVVARAAELLALLEARAGELTAEGELPLFAAARRTAAEAAPPSPPLPPPPDPEREALLALARALAALDPDTMTPKAALAALYELRALLPPSLSRPSVE